MIFLIETNLETDVDNLQQTDSASCSLVRFGSEPATAMIQISYYAQALSNRLYTKRRAEIDLDWLQRTERNQNTSNFLQNRGVGYKLRTY